MSDTVNNEVQPVLPAEPAPQVVPPADPVDETGVPYKNRVAEYQRKLQEQEALNQQYQIALGQMQQQRQAPPPQQGEDLDKLFDEPTRRWVEQKISTRAEQIAQQVGQRMLVQMQHQEALADTELVNEARPIYTRLKSNPMWASVDDALVQDRAIVEARSVLDKKKQTSQQQAQQQQSMQQVNRSSAQSASLPGTGGAPVQNAQDREGFIKQFMSDGDNLKMFKMFERGVDPSSPEGQKKFRQYAETAWEPTQFGGAVGAALTQMEIIK